MAKRIQKSSGGGDFLLTIDSNDLTDEVIQALRLAIHRALVTIGIKVQGWAVKNLSKPWKEGQSHVVTGRLRNSTAFYTDDNEVHIGTNVEYAQIEEEGNSKRPAHPFLRPAVEEHIGQIREIVEKELKGG